MLPSVGTRVEMRMHGVTEPCEGKVINQGIKKDGTAFVTIRWQHAYDRPHASGVWQRVIAPHNGRYTEADLETNNVTIYSSSMGKEN